MDCERCKWMDDAGTARGAQCGWRTDSGVGYSIIGEMKHHRTVCGDDTSEKR
jgi:hypothetical protein